jgi:hypothetical protein
MSNPDDFMHIDLTLRFIAEEKLGANHPVDIPCEYACRLTSDDGTADFLEEIAEAIRDGRLFAYMQHTVAKLPIDAGEWVAPDDGEPFFKPPLTPSNGKVSV